MIIFFIKDKVKGYQLFVSKDYPGFDINSFKKLNPNACAKKCNALAECVGFVFITNKDLCFLKSKVSITGRNFKSRRNIDVYVRLNAPSGKYF